jgi:hypothetical protein
MKFKNSCAEAAGINLSKADACFADKTRVAKLWKKQLALPFRSKISYFPTVLVNGNRLAEYKNGTGTFVEMVCNAYKVAGGSAPEGCSIGSTVEVNMLTPLP